MRPAEANALAARWMPLARSLARRYAPPPTYSREDWDAEAYLGLATALRDADPMQGARASFVHTVVKRHLTKARRDVNKAPKAPVELWLYLRNEAGYGNTPDPPRVTYAKAVSLDAPVDNYDDGDVLTGHDVTPAPASPDPAEVAEIASQVAYRLDQVRAAAGGMSPVERMTLGHMLRGLSTAQSAKAGAGTHAAVRTRRTRVRKKLVAAGVTS